MLCWLQLCLDRFQFCFFFLRRWMEYLLFSEVIVMVKTASLGLSCLSCWPQSVEKGDMSSPSCRKSERGEGGTASSRENFILWPLPSSGQPPPCMHGAHSQRAPLISGTQTKGSITCRASGCPTMLCTQGRSLVLWLCFQLGVEPAGFLPGCRRQNPNLTSCVLIY